MKPLLVFGRILAFIVITTVSCEYLINRASSTLLTCLCVVIVGLSFYFLIFKPLKQYIK